MDMSVSLWLFLAFSHMAQSLLSDQFNGCKKYFYGNMHPTGFPNILDPLHLEHGLPNIITGKRPTSKAYICQQYKNTAYFATLYDQWRRIPLYSAYILDKKSLVNLTRKQKKRPTTFNVEPQLVYSDLSGNMHSENDTMNSIKNYNKKNQIKGKEASDLLNMSQAVDGDYKRSGYTRGHINPNGHHVEQNSRSATFTLTNVAPMTKELNNNIWNKYENEMVMIAKRCSSMYVVTGVVPGKNWIRRNRVNIPSHVWSAHCCTDKNGRPIRSGGGIAPNDNSKQLTRFKMTELSLKLKTLLNIKGNITIFKNGCR